MRLYRNALATCRGWRAVSGGTGVPLSAPADRPASRTSVASGDIERSWLRAALAVPPVFSRRAPAGSAAGAGADGRPALVAAWLSAFVCAAVGGFALGVITGDGLPTGGAGAGEVWANHGARVDVPIPPAPATAAAGG
jgi:hypothetical protein